jgi:hypothetical protein
MVSDARTDSDAKLGPLSGGPAAGAARSGAPDPAPRPVSPLELALVLVVACGVVILAGYFTNRLDRKAWFFDEKAYVAMATNGPGKMPHPRAPFVFRPGTTLLAGAVARVAHVAPERAFAAIAWFALPLFLVLNYLLARRYTASRFRALLAMLCVGLSYSAIKRLVFDPISPDAIGLLFASVATLLLVQRRFWLLTAATAVGVACREFVLLPALVAAVGAIHPPAGGPRRLARLAPLGAALAVSVLIRLLIPFESSSQTVDPLVPESWISTRVILEPNWVANVVGASATFLLPLLCVWRERADGATRAPRWVWVYAAFLLVVMLFAGMNFMWFAAYFAPVLVVGYVVMADDEPPWLQIALVILVAAVNRFLEDLPAPERDLSAYIGFMAFYSHRVDLFSAVRVIDMLAAFACYRALRAGWREYVARGRRAHEQRALDERPAGPSAEPGGAAE